MREEHVEDIRIGPEPFVDAHAAGAVTGRQTHAVEGPSGSFRLIIVGWPLKSKPRSTSAARERS